ncbi:hypothetical protein L195_g019219, partial [Trifolium pratense]
SEEVATSVLVGDVLNIEEELCPNISVEADLVQLSGSHPNLGVYWKENDGSDIGHNVFTNEEERAVVINFLKNREVAREESFMEVVSKTKKKNLQKGFQVRNIRSKGRMSD